MIPYAFIVVDEKGKPIRIHTDMKSANDYIRASGRKDLELKSAEFYDK